MEFDKNNNKNNEFTADRLNECFATASQNIIELRDASKNYLKITTLKLKCSTSYRSFVGNVK